MHKKHEIIELVVKIVCDYFEIEDWRLLCKKRVYNKDMHAKYVCVYLLSKYLRVPIMSVSDYFKIGINVDSLRSKTNRVLYDISNSNLPYNDAVKKLSFLIENSSISKKDFYLVVPSSMIKKYDF